MKKIVMLLMLGLVGGLFANELTSRNMNYYWNFKQKKCVKTSFDLKKDILKSYQNGWMIIDEKFVNDAGTILVLLTELDGEEVETLVFSNFGVCRLYEDVIFKGLSEARDYQYIGLETYSDKPGPLKPEDKNSTK